MGYNTIYLRPFTLDQALSAERIREFREFSDSPHEGLLEHSVYCQWVPTADGKGIEWDGNEKFYEGKEWLQIIVEKFLKPWGLVLNGECPWYNELLEAGILTVTDNHVTEKPVSIEYFQAHYGRIDIDDD